jgi:hypothetical protein
LADDFRGIIQPFTTAKQPPGKRPEFWNVTFRPLLGQPQLLCPDGPGLEFKPGSIKCIIAEIQCRFEASPIGLVKVTDWSYESHLRGLHDKRVCGLLHTSGYRRHRQGDDEHCRAKHGAGKISRPNDEHVAHDVSRIIPGRMTGADAAQADHGYTHNGQ